MPVRADEVERRVEQMTAAIRAEGLRLTHQRLEIAREVAGTDEHPDVESVYQGVRSRVPTISLDTVYRTLATLAEHGLVSRIAATSGPARYDANVEHHHHFVCRRCGSIQDVPEPGLDIVRARETNAAYGAVEAVEVQLKGVCTACEADSTAGTPIRKRP